MEGKLNNGSSLEPEKSSFDTKELSEKKPLVSSVLIRTMAKDIAKLREIEVEEERKKIASMRPEEAKKETERRKKDEKEKQERERKEQEKKEKELILMKKKAEEEAKKIAAEEKRKREQEEKEFISKKKIEKKIEEERTKKMADEEKIRKEKEEKEILFQKFKEEELAKMRAEEESQKMAEEARKKAEETRRIAEETRRKAEEVQRIEKEIQRKKEEEAQIIAKEIQKKKEEEERILLLQKIREDEEKKKLEEMKPKEPIYTQPVYTQEEKTEQELILEKRKEELEKLIAEERTRKEIAKQQQNQKLKELLNKVKLPLEKLRNRTEQPKMTEMPMVQKPGGGFFRRMPTERIAEAPVQETEKTPERELIEKLQRVESQREKERLEREEFLKRVATGKFETKPATFQPETTRFPLMSKIPVKKTPLSDKLFIRIIVVGFLVAAWATLFTFWYWFTIGRKPQVVETTPTPTPVETQEPIAPASLIPVSSIKTIEFTTQKELRDGLYTILHNEYPKNQLQRILFKNTAEKKFLNLFEFFTAIGIDSPVALKQKLDPDFTFFFYSTEEYNRFGLITKIKDRENLGTSLKNWETTIEENFDNLFALIDKDKPAMIPYFRGAQHSGVTFRFQTFSRNDIGACYLIFGDYFAFTSSWDSMTKVIDLLK